MLQKTTRHLFQPQLPNHQPTVTAHQNCHALVIVPSDSSSRCRGCLLLSFHLSEPLWCHNLLQLSLRHLLTTLTLVPFPRCRRCPSYSKSLTQGSMLCHSQSM